MFQTLKLLHCTNREIINKIVKPLIKARTCDRKEYKSRYNKRYESFRISVLESISFISYKDNFG